MSEVDLCARVLESVALLVQIILPTYVFERFDVACSNNPDASMTTMPRLSPSAHAVPSPLLFYYAILMWSS